MKGAMTKAHGDRGVMGLVGTIVRKELLVNLLSLRFVIGLVVTAVLFGVVGIVLVDDFSARQQNYLSDVERHEKMLANTKVFSTIEVIVDLPPSPLSVFSHGIGDMPTSVHVSPYHVPSVIDEGGSRTIISLSGASNVMSNPLLKIFSSIDLSQLIATFLSLFAVLLVFDSFCGEREQGTLKILLSSSAGRSQILMGKYVGALVTLAIPLTVGFLEIMIVWSCHPGLSLNADFWTAILLAYIASLVFLASFLSFALFISLYARESSVSLMYLLITWIVVVVVIPEGGSYLAEYFRPAGLREKMVEDSRLAESEFDKKVMNVNYVQRGGWNNASSSMWGGESILGLTQEEANNRLEYDKRVFPMKFAFAEERYHVLESYASGLQSWSRLRNDMMRPSLSVMYENIIGHLAGTDVLGFADIVQRARLYRGELMSFLTPQVSNPRWFTRVFDYPDVEPTDQNRQYWQSLIEHQGESAVEKIMSWDRVTPLDLRSMPRPSLAMPPLGDRVLRSLGDLTMLILSTALFLALALRQANRYYVG